jgi:CBS domain-containing membrane protein
VTAADRTVLGVITQTDLLATLARSASAKAFGLPTEMAA